VSIIEGWELLAREFRKKKKCRQGNKKIIKEEEKKRVE
jgi:hypothetical protein